MISIVHQGYKNHILSMMVMTNKDIADFNKQLDEMKGDKGPNDLEKRIEFGKKLMIKCKK